MLSVIYQPTVVQGAMDPLPPEAAGPLELPVAGLKRRLVFRLLLSLCSTLLVLETNIRED